MHESLLSHDRARALFAPASWVGAMIRFEVALAEAEAGQGVIPASAAAALAGAAARVALDAGAIARAAAADGNPAIPFLRDFTAAIDDQQARAFLHWGATSQDLLDSALMLLLRDGLDLVEAGLQDLGDALAGLASRERVTPMAARTLLQQALPISLGVKAAFWLDPFVRHRARLAEIRGRVLVVALGGAAGSHAAIGAKGPAVAAALARALGLGVPVAPWHGARDRIAEAAFLLAALTGSAAKIARDLMLLMQTEVGEASSGRAGGSSTLPHKRNPTRALVAPAAHRIAAPLATSALLALEGEHERAAGAWHGEWPVLPRLVELAALALEATREALDDVVWDRARMRANLDLSQGLVFAENLAMTLAPTLGRARAKALVERLAGEVRASGRPLPALAAESPEVRAVLDAPALASAFDLRSCLGACDQIVDAVTGAWRQPAP